MNDILGNSRGMALIIVIFIVTALSLLTGSSLLFSSLDLRLATNRRLSDAAIQVADTGVQHALAVIPVGTDFSYSSLTSVVPSATHPGVSGFSYSVSAVNVSGNNAQAILTSTGLGPSGSKKVVVAYIGRGGYGFGAIHLAGNAPNIETQFSGTGFSINGNDRCNSAPSTAGITVSDPALVTEITNNTTSDGGLSSSQMGNVVGSGATPSVSSLSSSSTIVSDMVAGYLAHSPVELSGGTFAGNDAWGTDSNPQITRIMGSARILGNITGSGVLIVEGQLELSGNFSFNGLIIALGNVDVPVSSGNVQINGSLVMGKKADQDQAYELDVRGNAAIRYDSCALSPADNWIPLPKQPKLLGWQEKF